jgi:tRNA modification GTPase
MISSDTIVALSSGAPPSGVAVIRISGPATRALLETIAGGVPEPRLLTLRTIASLDRGLIAFFPGPHSFTGEDSAELQVHGSRAVVRGLLRSLAGQPGVRLATAGEFTRRAFENGKLDLTEVQGLGDLIEAETENQRALAYARLEGGLSHAVESWRERLLDLRAQVEAQLDFSDEGDVGALPATFITDLRALNTDISRTLATRGQGRIIREGFRVVLAGPPNAGKSSLLNALSRSDVAIVTDEPGTTRDLKDVPLDLDGQLVILVDSAGIRETTSKAEAAGIERAKAAMEQADLLLWLEAPDGPRVAPPDFAWLEEQWRRPPVLRIATKADIGAVEGADVAVSAATGAGIPELLDTILGASGATLGNPADLLVSHEEDRAALLASTIALGEVEESLNAPEIAAERLREASAALERLVGMMDAETVLDRLFLRFCIGK